MAVAPPTARIREESERATTCVVWFAVLAYVFAWGWSLPMAIAGETVEQGQGWPTHVVSLLTPLLAAVLVVGFRDGRAGVR